MAKKKSKHTRFTPKVREKFLTALAEHGLVTTAADIAGMSSSRVYEVKSKEPEFAAAWDAALETYRDSLEIEAYRRAVRGVDEPVFYQGEKCGVIRKYSDRLLDRLLLANRPDKFRDRVKMDADVQVGGVLIVPRQALPDDDETPRPGQAEEPE